MARTAITLRKFLANDTTSLPDPTGDAVDQANGMVLAASGLQTESVPPSYDGLRGLVFRVHNTAGSALAVTIRAGASNPPAFRKDLGDLAVTVTNATTKWVGPFDLARFQQSDGSVNVDFASGFTGDITAFILPRTV